MYFLLYNTVSAVLWLVIFILTVYDLATGSYVNPSAAPHWFLVSTQTANAVLEITHSVVGLVRSPLPSLLLQFFARLLITIGVSYTAPQSPGNVSWAYSGLSLAWSITEVVRYAFFASKQVKPPPYWLLWLRYLTFIVMYPLGLLCEPVVVYQTLGCVSGLHFYFLSLGMLLYVPGFLVLYRHMWRQRRRNLRS